MLTLTNFTNYKDGINNATLIHVHMLVVCFHLTAIFRPINKKWTGNICVCCQNCKAEFGTSYVIERDVLTRVI